MDETQAAGLPLQGRFVVPEVVATHFHLREGDTVADFGAGSGYFLDTLAAAVGESGVIYACEIQKDLVEKLGTIAHTKGLRQVRPLWCDIEEVGGSKVPEGALDVAILVNTFFQFEDREAGLREIMRTMRSGGKFFLIDWSESFGGLGPQPAAVVTEQEATDAAEAVGFVLERSFDAGDHHYGLSFRKP